MLRVLRGVCAYRKLEFLIAASMIKNYRIEDKKYWTQYIKMLVDNRHRKNSIGLNKA
jgi:hypothetical protein